MHPHKLIRKDFMKPATQDQETATAPGVTMTSLAVDRLRNDILGGTFTPSTRLRIDELKALYGVGGSPMREALSRLVSEGLVDSLNQKGFRVAPVSTEDLLDITETRQSLEGTAIERAIERGDDVWEGNVLGALHRLEKYLDRNPEINATKLPEWEEIHAHFHRTLISACGSSRLTTFCLQLYNQGTRYRHLLQDYNFASRDLIAEHRDLVDAVLSRDAARARSVLEQHIALTADIILSTETDIIEGTPS
jgi:GntR family transcriptional regulator, carbon starvation induced regulator